MKEKIVHSATGITILGGAKVKKRQITRAMDSAPFLVAADSGAETALKMGLMPDAVIGDMDSTTDLETRVPKDRLHRITEQTSTDFEKCLYSVTAPFVIALGVIGSRLDHSLATLNALSTCREYPVIALGGKDLVFLCPPTLTIKLPVDTRLSLFPLGEVTGQSVGLEWPIEGLHFSPLGRVGTSNNTVASVVELHFDAPRMLVILPRKHLDAVLEAVL